MQPERICTLFFSPTGTSRKTATAVARGIAAPFAATADSTATADSSGSTDPANHAAEANRVAATPENGPIPVRALDLTHAVPRPETLSADTVAVFAAPVYGGRIPRTALERMEGIRGEGTPAVVIAVYGNRAFEKAAAELAERFRREKKVVGFTNGCFDLLHLGHLHSFMKAREACDVLFVGLNTDASIKRLKGEDRPINNEEMRSLLLASLDFVDYVVPFDEDTALPLIEKLRPDVIAKEGYPLECWPEGQFVKSYGGQALELPRLEGFSSTNIINRMKSSPE